MTRFNDERAPLEMTKVSNKQKIVVCPYCKTARSVSVNWYGGICSKDGKYFNVKNSLSESEAVSELNQNVPINKAFTKLKADMEKKAYDYRDKEIAKRKSGNIESHEPDGKKRNWGKY